MSITTLLLVFFAANALYTHAVDKKLKQVKSDVDGEITHLHVKTSELRKVVDRLRMRI